MMKIGVILESLLQSGGGFQQSINAILQLKRIAPEGVEIHVFSFYQENIKMLTQFNIPATHFKIRLFDRISNLYFKSTLPSFLSRFIPVISRFESFLLKHSIGLVYFLSPSPHALTLQRLNYLFTLWDLCHRDMLEFPEVRALGEFEHRERVISRAIKKAVLTLTDSETLSEKCSHYYGVDKTRLIAMPFSPASFVNQQNQDPPQQQKLVHSDYFFYPAQFWAHKNHIRILHALKLLQADGQFPKVVFCGSDKGNLSFVKSEITRLKLDDQVVILGFVPNDQMQSLYRNAMALIMPTYFGPTNLPPLEAWSYGVPVIYSEHLKEQTGDAALYVDPDSEKSIVLAMYSIINEHARQKVITQGYEMLKLIDEQRLFAEARFAQFLDSYRLRRFCWS